jgi:hypothetical protein
MSDPRCHGAVVYESEEEATSVARASSEGEGGLWGIFTHDDHWHVLEAAPDD